MPYNNPYNRKIAKEVKTINEKYIDNVGENYPSTGLKGGSLDTGYDTMRIVGGAKAIDNYVKGVLEGTYLTPTQGMPSSSMSGLGMSAGKKKYTKKGMGMSGGATKPMEVVKEMIVEENMKKKRGMAKKKPLVEEKIMVEVKPTNGRKSSPWIAFVKQVAKDKGIKYGEALKIASTMYKK